MSFIVKLYNIIPYQIKASIIILAASFITNAISFITTPIFTRVMTVEEFGLVTQYNSVLEVIKVIATLSLTAGVYQVAMNEFKNDRDCFTFSSLLLSNLCTIVVFAVIFLFIKPLSEKLQLYPNLFLCMFIYLLFTPATQMWLAKQRYEYKYKEVAVVSIITTAASLLFGVFAILVIKDYNLGAVRIWAIAIVQVVCALIIYYSFAKKSAYRPKLKYIKYAFTFNLPLIVHYLAQYVLRSSDKIMITSYCGEYATGLYGLGATVASLAIIAWSAMAASLTPYMYTHLSTKEYEKINNAVVAVIGIFGICCIIVAMIGPEIVYVLGSAKYIENIQLIPPIAASSLLSAIYGIYSTVVFYYHKRTSTAVMTIVAAILNIALNYLLIPKYGYIAAAYTTEIAYLIYTVLHFINYRIIVKDEKVLNDKAIWLITAFTTLVCLATAVLYGRPLLRYAILGFIVIITVIRRQWVFDNCKLLIKNKN